MEPFTNSNTPPLSIAQVDWTLYGERELTALGSQRPAADLLEIQGTLLAAVITRVGEVEAAEWALDQRKPRASCRLLPPWPPECQLQCSRRRQENWRRPLPNSSTIGNPSPPKADSPWAPALFSDQMMDQVTLLW